MSSHKRPKIAPHRVKQVTVRHKSEHVHEWIDWDERYSRCRWCPALRDKKQPLAPVPNASGSQG